MTIRAKIVGEFGDRVALGDVVLKDCAHCGGAPHQPYFGDRVECSNHDCQASTPTVAAWNARKQGGVA